MEFSHFTRYAPCSSGWMYCEANSRLGHANRRDSSFGNCRRKDEPCAFSCTTAMRSFPRPLIPYLPLKESKSCSLLIGRRMSTPRPRAGCASRREECLGHLLILNERHLDYVPQRRQPVL